MSNKPNCYFKTTKNTNQSKSNTKNSGRANLFYNAAVNPKKIENPRQMNLPDYLSESSENIVCYSPERNQNITKNLEIIQEE